MADPATHQTPAPGQTIVIERRPRGGCFKTVAVVLLFLLGFSAISALTSRTTGLTADRLTEQLVTGPLTGKNKVAVVQIDGIIIDKTVEYAVRQLRQARRDDAVKAVVLRVDSPGGTVTGSDRIWREVSLLRDAGKPTVVSMGGLAASGGYYVSAPADMIIAEPTTTTGSIGVILELPNVSELLDKVGVDFESITAGSWKDAGSPFRPLSERDRDRFQEMVDSTYERFVRVVAQGRNLTMDQALEVADGKVFSADEALEIGLIDRLGYQEDAIQEAITRADLTKPRVIKYKKPLLFPGGLFGIEANANKAYRFDEETVLRLRTPRMLMLMH